MTSRGGSWYLCSPLLSRAAAAPVDDEVLAHSESAILCRVLTRAVWATGLKLGEWRRERRRGGRGEREEEYIEEGGMTERGKEVENDRGRQGLPHVVSLQNVFIQPYIYILEGK